MGRRKTFDPEEDCFKIPVRDCKSKRLKNTCKVDYETNKCVFNEFQELDKFIEEKGFKNFKKFNEDNIEQEIPLREKLCNNLDPTKGGMCTSNLGLAYGCVVSKSFFGKRTCKLSPKIKEFYTTIRALCSVEGCLNKRKVSYNICNEHLTDFKDAMQILKSVYRDIKTNVNKSKTEKFLDDFYYMYEYIIDNYHAFLLDRPDLTDMVEKMFLEIESEYGTDNCQAYNIKSCENDEKGNQLNSRCVNLGHKTKEGMFCKIHLKCYHVREKNFKKLRDNLEDASTKGFIKALIKKNEEFLDMIEYTTEGEASKMKIEIRSFIQLAREFNSY